MKFWKATIFFSMVLLALLAGIVLHIIEVSSEDRKSYEELMAMGNREQMAEKDKSYPLEYLREGTSKTLLLSQKNKSEEEERRIGKLHSRSSTLYFSKDNQALELVEEMNQVLLIAQEELTELGQVVVYLEAATAVYYYTQEKLVAENVQIIRYKIPSHTFPDSQEIKEDPFFRGNASRVVISLNSRSPWMQATNLKAAAI